MSAIEPITPEEIEYIKKIPMLFIIGKGRSGTSLLQNLLDAHPQIVGAPESKFAVLLYSRFSHIKKWKERDILDFVDKLYMDPLFAAFWHVDRKELTDALLAVTAGADYSLLCKIVYYQMRKDKENLIYLSDKNPVYTLCIDTILKIFPESKFIHIVREPRDNIYSQIASFKSKNIAFRAYQWVAFNSIIEQSKKKVPEKYFTVLYENLVTDTEKTMKLVCDYLNISFTTTMIQNKGPEWLNTHVETIGVTGAKKFVHRNLLQPIDTSHVGKWKNKMSLYDQVLTEVITGDFAKKLYGYDIDGNRNNKPIKISSITLLKGKYFYIICQELIRLKMKSFRFNLLYSLLKRKTNKKLPK
ncbi:MAG TPA: sulfotransferase [Bacteroidia bacterium]|jgi:protein-tyrosine sulfotransferase|nr:sulfotransferase [Bacteroidia bacterium]